MLDRVGRDVEVNGIEGLMTQRDRSICTLGRSGVTALCIADVEDKSDAIWPRPETVKEQEGEEFRTMNKIDPELCVSQ